MVSLQEVEIVLTAHPTQINRRTLQYKHIRIAVSQLIFRLLIFLATFHHKRWFLLSFLILLTYNSMKCDRLLLK